MVSDALGRRTALLISSIAFLLSAIGTAFASELLHSSYFASSEAWELVQRYGQSDVHRRGLAAEMARTVWSR